MLTVLGLLVYSIIQRQVRLYLRTQDQQLPGNKGLTATPTAAVVLALFAQVALVQLWIDEQEVVQISGVQPHHRLVCDALGLDARGMECPQPKRQQGHSDPLNVGSTAEPAAAHVPGPDAGLPDLAFVARVTRSAMLEVLREDYLRTARAKGLREMAVIGRHALKNALLPVVTVSGYQFGRLLGGVIIVESIFVVPGMGTLLIHSIVHRDFIVIQAVVLLIAAVVLTLNLVIDLLYGVLDPRIRYQ